MADPIKSAVGQKRSDDQQSISGWSNRFMRLSTFFTTRTICQDIQYLFILIFPFKSSYFVLFVVTVATLLLLTVVDSIVAISLFEFLLDDDQNRKKLKKCYKCNEFYVQGKLNPKQKYCPKCSPKSKMSKEERREYQKNWRKKKKDEKLKKESEAKIKNYMSNLGCTREEAEKIIEADSKL